MYRKQKRSASKKGEPVFIDDGFRRVCAGYIDGGAFVKVVEEKHILRKPEAIAVQANILDLLTTKGCNCIIARLIDRNKQLTASVDDFKRFGFRLNRGFGEQIALPLSKWTDLDKRNAQGSLF